MQSHERGVIEDLEKLTHRRPIPLAGAANYRAAQRARSHAEFRAKLQIAMEEVDESHFWIGLIGEASYRNMASLQHLEREAYELTAMAAPQALQRVTEPNVVAYEVRVRTMVCASYEIPQVAAPVISISAGVATLSCATAGAAVFYTVDGSSPVPRGETASLYSAPFAVSSGGTLRVRAWLAGYLASAETREVAP